MKHAILRKASSKTDGILAGIKRDQAESKMDRALKMCHGAQATATIRPGIRSGSGRDQAGSGMAVEVRCARTSRIARTICA